MINMSKNCFLFLIIMVAGPARSQVILPQLFSNDMVLQRGMPIRIWGEASPAESIEVHLNNQSKRTSADKEGGWSMSLDAEPAGGPYELTVTGKNTITLSNVLIGDVWICSGQSNMEWPVADVVNAETEIRNATDPLIRHFAVQKELSTRPKEKLTAGEWKVCSPETVVGFTAVGYFFSKEVYHKTRVPIGLIHTSYGGTNIETWTSSEAYEKTDEFKHVAAKSYDKILEHVQSLLDRFTITMPTKAEIEAWKGANVDHSKWPKLPIPQHWEYTIGKFDGTIWIRRDFDVTQADALKPGTLELSMIDDGDETFVNGVKVGGMDGYDQKRIYQVAANILKAGKNTVTVKITDGGGGGGIYGDPKDVRLVTQSQTVIPLAGEWHFRIEKPLDPSDPNAYPSLLFNAMVKPLVNFNVRGILWYQGEHNVSRAYEYRKMFPLMIKDWRHHFKQDSLPFYFVQLPNFKHNHGNSENGSEWAELREAQQMALSLPNTGMAVTIDIGETESIHPRNKQDVGKRLAALALDHVYKVKVPNRGPTYQSTKVEGNKARILFSGTGSGLIAKAQDGILRGFELAGEDGRFYAADAQIVDNEVVVSCSKVNMPVAVRYAWSDDPKDANLYNQDGFPAAPFRTDHWRSITEGRLY
jgi:sialate O-acetylesterase